MIQCEGFFGLKRLFDILASLFGLILLSPVIAVVAWQISRKLGSPVLFRQVRPGKDGKPFEMVKFRTMKDAIDAAGNPFLRLNYVSKIKEEMHYYDILHIDKHTLILKNQENSVVWEFKSLTPPL